LIIGTLTNSKALGIFNIGSQLVFSFIAFASAISNIFTPKIVQMVEQKTSTITLMTQLCTIARYQMMVLGFIFVLFAAFGELFIKLFVGTEFLEAFWVALIPMLPFMFVLAQTSTNTVLQALNKHKVRSILLLVTAIFNVVISIVLVKKLGIVGAALGTALALFIGELILVNIYLYRAVKLNMLYFYLYLIRHSLPVILIIGPLAFLMSKQVSATWTGLVLGCFTSGVIYIICVYLISLTPKERIEVNKIVCRK